MSNARSLLHKISHANINYTFTQLCTMVILQVLGARVTRKAHRFLVKP